MDGSEIRDLYRAVLGGVSGIEYTAQLGDGDERALMVRYRAGRGTVEEALWLRFGEDGLIAEMWSFVRPLAGLTAMSAAVVPRYAGRRQAWRRPVMATFTRPLATLIRFADPLGTWLADVRRR